MVCNFFFISIFWFVILDLLMAYDGIMSQLFNFIFKDDPRGVPNYPYVKPFSCSSCCTFWSILIYMIVSGNMTIFAFMMAAVFAYAPTLYNQTYNIIKWKSNDLLMKNTKNYRDSRKN